jgi:O-methyltransferase
VPPVTTPSYDSDNLAVWLKSVSFLHNRRFRSAYARGMDSGHHICRDKGSRDDLHIEWRVHVLLWAAAQAAGLDGDFVECGVNTGIYSLAVCEYVDFNRLDKQFYLFDTFQGIPDEQISQEERALNREAENAANYSECYDVARRNFSDFPRARLVRGRVPDSLRTVDIDRVAYLSIDMNIVQPEIAALEWFWDKLSMGAPVVFDDYGWLGFLPQKTAIDAFAEAHGVPVLELPTGQGLMIKR